MSALSYYELGHWGGDKPASVHREIRALCMVFNDDVCTSDEMREKLIGPHLFTPYGTAGGGDLRHWTRAFHDCEGFPAAQLGIILRACREAGIQEVPQKDQDLIRSEPWMTQTSYPSQLLTPLQATYTFPAISMPSSYEKMMHGMWEMPSAPNAVTLGGITPQDVHFVSSFAPAVPAPSPSVSAKGLIEKVKSYVSSL